MACLTGDQRAFNWIVRTYKHLVFTVAMRVLRNREEAEEVTQDSFVKVWQNLRGYQGGSKFSTWMYSIAYRTAISKLRTRKQTTTDLDDVAEERTALAASNDTGLNDRKAALEMALASLGPEDATVVSLFYLQEQSVEEIVTVTGLSASNIKVKLFRGRKKMLDTLQHHLKHELWTLQEE